MKTEKTRLKKLLSIARLVYNQLGPTNQFQPKPSIEPPWKLYEDEFARTQELLQLCRSKQWLAAEAEMRAQVSGILNDVQSLIANQIEELDLKQPPKFSIGEIYRDLIALEEDFGEVSFDKQSSTLSVVTQPIELEELYLGSFEIRLQVKTLSPLTRGDYEVVAVDPNPAGQNPSVTHPHVQDESLCEGEAWNPITLALKQGRLLDFFMLVNGVLNTYNESSPYVPIDEWARSRCNDCDDTYDAEDGSFCGCCDSILCSACSYVCESCDTTRCHHCSRDCDLCQANICEACVRFCTDCRKSVCEQCYQEERCKNCDQVSNQKEPLSNPDESDEDSPTSETVQEPAEPPFHSVCLGETIVSP